MTRAVQKVELVVQSENADFLQLYFVYNCFQKSCTRAFMIVQWRKLWLYNVLCWKQWWKSCTRSPPARKPLMYKYCTFFPPRLDSSKQKLYKLFTIQLAYAEWANYKCTKIVHFKCRCRRVELRNVQFLYRVFMRFSLI